MICACRVQWSYRVDCTALPACWHSVGGWAGPGRGTGDRAIDNSLRLYIYLFRGASERRTVLSAVRQLRRVARIRSVGKFSLFFLSPLSRHPSPLPPFLLATKQRRGRFLSIDPLLTTLDESQVTTTYGLPTGERAARRREGREAGGYRTTPSAATLRFNE